MAISAMPCLLPIGGGEATGEATARNPHPCGAPHLGWLARYGPGRDFTPQIDRRHEIRAGRRVGAHEGHRRAGTTPARRKRRTGLEPATYGLGSRRSTN